MGYARKYTCLTKEVYGGMPGNIHALLKRRELNVFCFPYTLNRTMIHSFTSHRFIDEVYYIYTEILYVATAKISL